MTIATIVGVLLLNQSKNNSEGEVARLISGGENGISTG